jgi:hypothetical protein
MRPCHRAVANTPPKWLAASVSYAARHAAFTRVQKVQPLGRDFFEATSRLLSLRPDDLLTIPRMALSIDERFGFPLPLYPSYEVSDFYLGGFASH